MDKGVKGGALGPRGAVSGSEMSEKKLKFAFYLGFTSAHVSTLCSVVVN